jgi:hypothetical protein
MEGQSQEDNSLHTFTVGDSTVVATSPNGRDFSRVHGEHLEKCNLYTFGAALIQYAESILDKPKGMQYDFLDSGERVSASLYLDNPHALAWDEFGFISINFTATPKAEVLMALRAAGIANRQAIADAIDATIRRYSMTLIHIIDMDHDGFSYSSAEEGYSRQWEIAAYINTKDFDLATLFSIHLELAYSVFYSGATLSTARQAFELVKIGQIAALLGMRECEWLDAKQAAYDLKTGGDLWKLELSQDVASFANAEQGGLVIIGVGTRNIDGSDVLIRIQPVPVTNNRIRRYHDIIHARVYPPIDGLVIERVAFGKGELICLYVPPQRDFLKPFIVDGGRVGKKHHGGMFSIVRRRGEDTMALNARELHAQIVAGRAFLRGEYKQVGDEL